MRRMWVALAILNACLVVSATLLAPPVAEWVAVGFYAAYLGCLFVACRKV